MNLITLLLFISALLGAVVTFAQQQQPENRFGEYQVPPLLDRDASDHEDNWAILVSSSKYWHNLRQSNNVFLLYNLLRQNGFGDDKILLFVSENQVCDRRNPDTGFSPCTSETSFPNKTTFGANVEIDFEGYNADAQTFLRVLYGSQAPGTPLSKQLRSTKKSNVLVFVASHSGEFFTKFQDYEFLSAHQMSHAFQEMHRLGKYNRLLFIPDTCKASTLFEIIDAPNVVSLASSGPTDDGMAHNTHFNDRLAGQTNDAMLSEMFDFVANENVKKSENTPLRNMFRFLKRNPFVRSNVSMSHTEQYFRSRGQTDVLGAEGGWAVSDFFNQKEKKATSAGSNKKKPGVLDRLDGDFAFWSGF